MSHLVPGNLLVEVPPNKPGQYAALRWSEGMEDNSAPPRKEQRKIIVSAVSLNNAALSRSYSTTTPTNQHFFNDLNPGTLYRFVVCYEWGTGYAQECSNEVILKTNGTTPVNPPSPTKLEETPSMLQVSPKPATLKTKASITIQWNDKSGVIFDDFSWEWQTRTVPQNQDWTDIGLTSTEEPSAEIKPVKRNTDYEFRVRLRRKGFLQAATYSEWAQTSVKSSPPHRSIREFLQGEVSSGGLGKLLRKYGHDTKSLLSVLRG